MKQKRKRSRKDLLERLQGGEIQMSVETFQDQHQQSNKNQFDPSSNSNEVQPQENMSTTNSPQQDVNMTNSPSSDDTFDPSLISSDVQPQQKKDPLLVKVKDTCTGEIITKKMIANQVWHLEKTKKVVVELNDFGQGDNSSSNLLVRFLGQVAKKSVYCPISVKRWDEMPEKCSKDQWKCIEDHFEFDYADGIKWVWSTLGERWKAYKYKLRNKYFYPNKSKEEILANPPSNMDPIEWTSFVHHYNDPKMKKQSEQNSINRKKLKVSHAGGSKSNARRGREMELQLGRHVCRSEVILATLMKKDGNYVNEEGKAMAEKISEVLSEDKERTAAVGVSSKINVYPDDAIGKIYGAEHSGRVRGLGLGVCPTHAFGKRRHFTNFIDVGSFNQKNVEDLQKNVESLGEKLIGYEETKEQLTQTKEQLTQTTEKLTQAQHQLEILQNFMKHKFGDELSIFNSNASPN
ncbi:uncharacterized protein LOC131615238 [Vicia villosa]|uniref:uncharacterized protein LOC131615238 n=1 Tax=Vicia villosa TaxID=3911 RepID=UPI00273B4928|nr:uncharacterized protein LOC131615238 [Vicia villosa]